MNFDFSDDQKVLRDQARKFLSERAAPARVRHVLDTDVPYDTDLWRGMAEMAWPGTAVPEAYGGAGFGYLELCVIAEELGRSLAPTPFSSSVYLATEAILLAGSDGQRKHWLPKLALGEALGCFALAEGVKAPAPGNITTVARDGRLTGVKLPVADGDVADLAIVAARTAEGAGDRTLSLFLVDLAGPGVTR
ncbi:MAG: acyl-CoA dehydrogenase family protein, partial [Candidatus Limnocylindria bacterium]